MQKAIFLLLNEKFVEVKSREMQYKGAKIDFKIILILYKSVNIKKYCRNFNRNNFNT